MWDLFKKLLKKIKSVVIFERNDKNDMIVWWGNSRELFIKSVMEFIKNDQVVLKDPLLKQV